MGFSDLHYGWHRQLFELSDVSISREIQLQESGEDGAWQERSPDISGDFAESEEEARKLADEYGNKGELRHSGLRGTLNANARMTDHMDQMALGVPDDKQSIHIPREQRVDRVRIQITATDSPNASKRGSIRYFEESEYVEADVYATFYVTEACFDDIVRMTNEPGAVLQVSLNIRGWYWLGPIGDSQVYINSTGWERAELGAIRATRSIPNPTPSDESQDY